MDTARARRLLNVAEVFCDAVRFTFTIKAVKVPVVGALLGASRPALGIERTPPVGHNLIGVGGDGLAALSCFKTVERVAVVAVEPCDVVARRASAPARIVHRMPPAMFVAISPCIAASVLAALYFLKTVELFAAVRVAATHASNVVAVVAFTRALAVEG